MWYSIYLLIHNYLFQNAIDDIPIINNLWQYVLGFVVPRNVVVVFVNRPWSVCADNWTAKFIIISSNFILIYKSGVMNTPTWVKLDFYGYLISLFQAAIWSKVQ